MQLLEASLVFFCFSDNFLETLKFKEMTAKLIDLKQMELTELSFQETTDVSGGIAPALGILIACGGFVCGVGFAILVCYAAYRILK